MKPAPTDTFAHLHQVYAIALHYVNQFCDLPEPYSLDPEYVVAHALVQIIKCGGVGQGANARMTAIKEFNERLYGKAKPKENDKKDLIETLDLSKLNNDELETLHTLLAKAAPEEKDGTDTNGRSDT